MELVKHVNSIIMLRGYFSAGLDDRIGWITVETHGNQQPELRPKLPTLINVADLVVLGLSTDRSFQI